jgi:hypothetical protein
MSWVISIALVTVIAISVMILWAPTFGMSAVVTLWVDLLCVVVLGSALFVLLGSLVVVLAKYGS